MNNLYEETLEALQKHGKTEKDVLMVVGYPFYTDWEHFRLNSKFYYDNGFGCPEINTNLKIVGNTWWLERSEYDGSEWWVFKENINANGLQKCAPANVMKLIKGDL